MAAVDSHGRRVVPFSLGGRSFRLLVTHRGAARALGIVLRRFARGGRGPAVDLDLDPPTRDATRFSEVLAATLRLAAAQLFPHHLLVHAAAVVGARGAVLFVGPTGVGKTTIALVARRLGLEVLADDVACIRVRDRVVVSAPMRMRARVATVRLFGRARPPTSKSAHPLKEIVLVGAGRRALTQMFGSETLLGELPPQKRWEAACLVADVIEGVPIRRMPRVVLHRPAVLRRNLDRIAEVFRALGVDERRIARVLRRR